MILETLTRIPGKKIPAEVLTGDPALDAFLSCLDRRLLGSANVRLQMLAEIKDHLLDKRRYFLEAGFSESTVVEKVLQSIGSPDELAHPQRDLLKKKFFRIGLPSGILFGLFMGLFALGMPSWPDWGLVSFSLYALAQGTFFGLVVGWFMTFVWPERRLPSASAASGDPEVGASFIVQYDPWMRRLSYFCIAFFILMAVSSILIGIAASFNASISVMLPFAWWIAVVSGGLAFMNVFFVRLGCRRYRVNEVGILVEEFPGIRKNYTWKDLKRVGLLGDIRPWVPLYWKKVRYAEFKRGNQKLARLFIYPDMTNADRLSVLLEQEASA